MKTNTKEFAKSLSSFGRTTPEENSAHSSVLKLCLNCGDLSFPSTAEPKMSFFKSETTAKVVSTTLQTGTNSTKFSKKKSPINNRPTKQLNKQPAVKPKVLGQHPTCRWHSAERRDAPPNSAPLKQQQLDLSQRNVHGSIEGWSYSHPSENKYSILYIHICMLCLYLT